MYRPLSVVSASSLSDRWSRALISCQQQYPHGTDTTRPTNTLPSLPMAHKAPMQRSHGNGATSTAQRNTLAQLTLAQQQPLLHVGGGDAHTNQPLNQLTTSPRAHIENTQ